MNHTLSDSVAVLIVQETATSGNGNGGDNTLQGLFSGNGWVDVINVNSGFAATSQVGANSAF